MKVLAVDDSKAVHAFMKNLFEGTEHDLRHAYDGKEAVEQVKNEQPDIVLLDWEMPVMDGVQTLVAIREGGFNMPIVMVTSKNEVSQIVQALEKGANEYVMKPFTKEILFEKLSMVLGKEVA